MCYINKLDVPCLAIRGKTNIVESGQHLMLCVLPCHASLPVGIRSLCVVGLGEKHAESALEGADCLHYESVCHCICFAFGGLSLEGAFTSIPRRTSGWARVNRRQELGVKIKCQERCAFSITEDHLSRLGVWFDHGVGTIVPCSVRVNPHDSQESERRPVTHCQCRETL